jgi:predicted amidohydrolase YtcJ
MMRFIFLLLIPALSLYAAEADLILHNGKIVTADSRFSIEQAIAVKDGKISAVGSDQVVLRERGPRTQVIDLAGKTVLPGLIDSHVHALSAGLSEFREPLPPLDSFAAIRSFIRARAAKTPKGEWIVVPRTFPTRLKEMRMPTHETLDVDRDHPVMFDASYTVVLNSAGLARSGITRDTPNPPRGEIVKDRNGEPNGILKNGMSLLKGLKQDDSGGFSEAEKLQALEQMLLRYRDAGLTAVSDRAVDAEQIALYRKLRAQNRLPIRVVMTWRPESSLPAEELVRQIRSADFSTGTGDAWLKFGAFKMTLDGGMTIGTAYQRVPYGEFGEQLYGQTHPDDRGLLFVTPAKALTVYGAARAKGWQLTAHCQGGGAVDSFLDALEAVNRQRPIAPTRSHLMHASFQSPEAIARTKRLGLSADIQMPWLYHDGPALEKVFGSDGMRYFIPLRSYLDAGVMIVGGSDHMIGYDKNRAVNPYNPFLSMWIAVARKTTEGKVLRAEQRITRQEALRMHTSSAAYLQFAENTRGSLETGKLADLVVIDRDYLTVPEDEIRNIQPIMAIVDGQIAYRK